MQNKKLIAALVAVVLLIAAFAGIYTLTRPATAEGSKSFTLTVVHSDGSEKKFEYHTDEEFLGTVLQAEGIITGYMGDYGMMIEEVDGERAVWAENGAYWALFVGEEYGTAGVDTTPVYDGSDFSLVYTLG